MRASLSMALIWAGIATTACGGESESNGYHPAAGGTGGSSTIPDGGSTPTDGTGGGSTIPDGGFTPTDAGSDSAIVDIINAVPIPDSGPMAACAGCLSDQCANEIAACAANPACANGMACMASDCGTGASGTPDLACAMGCFGGDLAAMQEAMAVATCASGSCTDPCGSTMDGG
jgi:hypothetical protein